MKGFFVSQNFAIALIADLLYNLSMNKLENKINEVLARMYRAGQDNVPIDLIKDTDPTEDIKRIITEESLTFAIEELEELWSKGVEGGIDNRIALLTEKRKVSRNE